MSTRFARVVEDLEYIGLNNKMVCESTDVLTALQREHAAVRRKVKALGRGVSISQFGSSNECFAYRQACSDLLAWLDERGR